jgi:hypothetical protein
MLLMEFQISNAQLAKLQIVDLGPLQEGVHVTLNIMIMELHYVQPVIIHVLLVINSVNLYANLVM